MVSAPLTVSLFSHLQAVTIVDSRWDLILLPYRLVFLLLLFSRMGPFCHLIEAHGLGCETAHMGIRRQAAEFPQPLSVPHSIRMHRILTFHNLWVSRLILPAAIKEATFWRHRARYLHPLWDSSDCFVNFFAAQNQGWIKGMHYVIKKTLQGFCVIAGVWALVWSKPITPLSTLDATDYSSEATTALTIN